MNIVVRTITRSVMAVTVLAVLSGEVRADAFEDGVADAYASFRIAASYLRTGNAGLASLDLADAVDSWSAITQAAKSTMPTAYAKDAEFNATLDEVGKRLTDGLALAENGDAKGAGEKIDPVRQLIYDLRVRNGKRVYADCITELNAAMDKMWIYRRSPPDFSDPAVQKHTADVQKEYAAVLKDCVGMASEADRKNEEFKRLSENTEISNDKLGEAVAAQDPVSYINYLRELRSLDRIIFFRFGS